MVAHHITVTVAADGTIRLPPDAARPGETITVQIERPTAAEPVRQPTSDEPVRLTRLTAKTPEQKAQWRREMDNLIDRLEPMLRGTPGSLDHGDALYDENGLPK